MHLAQRWRRGPAAPAAPAAPIVQAAPAVMLRFPTARMLVTGSWCRCRCKLRRCPRQGALPRRHFTDPCTESPIGSRTVRLTGSGPLALGHRRPSRTSIAAARLRTSWRTPAAGWSRCRLRVRQHRHHTRTRASAGRTLPWLHTEFRGGSACPKGSLCSARRHRVLQLPTMIMTSPPRSATLCAASLGSDQSLRCCRGAFVGSTAMVVLHTAQHACRCPRNSSAALLLIGRHQRRRQRVRSQCQSERLQADGQTALTVRAGGGRVAIAAKRSPTRSGSMCCRPEFCTNRPPQCRRMFNRRERWQRCVRRCRISHGIGTACEREEKLVEMSTLSPRVWRAQRLFPWIPCRVLSPELSHGSDRRAARGHFSTFRRFSMTHVHTIQA